MGRTWCSNGLLRYSFEVLKENSVWQANSRFPIATEKLAGMITEITKAQLLTWRLGVLKNEDVPHSAQISWPRETMWRLL